MVKPGTLALSQGLVDESEDFALAFAGGDGAAEDGGFTIAPILHRSGEEFDVFLDELGFHLVGLGEDEGEGDPVFDEPGDELLIEFLRGVSGVDEDKDAAEALSHENVFRDKFVEAVALAFRHLGVAVAGEIDEPPLLVDVEEIHLLRATGSLGDAGEAFLPSEQIDE